MFHETMILNSGKGLGKHETGIKTHIKPNLKFDTCGMGYQEEKSKQDNHPWWEDVYNRTAKNVTANLVSIFFFLNSIFNYGRIDNLVKRK